MCCRRAKKNRGQKSICGHKKGGQYSISHWKIGVKILCSKSWEGQNSMKAKIWGSKFYFFLVEPLVKILCSLKRGVKILYFFPVPWKRGVKTAEPTNQLHWRGAPPPPGKFGQAFNLWLTFHLSVCLFVCQRKTGYKKPTVVQGYKVHAFPFLRGSANFSLHAILNMIGALLQWWW